MGRGRDVLGGYATEDVRCDKGASGVQAERLELLHLLIPEASSTAEEQCKRFIAITPCSNTDLQISSKAFRP
jgi:hypothetical protein